MTQTEAEIGIVEDREGGRVDLADMAQDLKEEGYNNSINVPLSFDEMQRLFLFRNLDGLLIDVNLRKWDLSKRLIERVEGIGPIHDGIDIAHLAFNLYKRAKDAICIYSSEVNLEEPKWVRKLASLPFTPTVVSKLESYAQLKTYFRDLSEKADKVRTANPLLQPPNFDKKTSPKERLHAFKSIYFNSTKWINTNFEVVGDYAWLVVCGHSVERDFYGRQLNGGHGDKFGIIPQDGYPDLKALKAVSKRRESFPFIIWNTRKTEFLEPQFEQAGEQLRNIPRAWQSFFGVAMAPACARAYVNDGERRVLNWCRELDEIGQVEVTKRIYKSLLGQATSNLPEFKRTAVRLELPQIVDVLEAKVEEIDESESRALVHLKSPRGGTPYYENFNLKILRRMGVRYVDQRFDYTVYRQPHGSTVANIEPMYTEEEDA